LCRCASSLAPGVEVYFPALPQYHRGDRQMSQDRVIIFDTTLRDGEQSPGASMTREEKLRIARALEKLRVDVIEAGFAIASPRSEEHTSELQSRENLVCRLLLEKK